MIGFIVWAINSLINLYVFLIVIWCLLSWFPGASRSSLGEFLDRLVRPYLAIFERIIPPLGGVSFSPIVAVLVLWFAQRGVQMLGSLM
ncbi:YggT family protein [uncultured Limosilactobacillus sp.]|uniref:YggT family protein n=1 Tax=uncultured Limosilactobacillus sp. TaxID=2837629 RepID=UPI0025CBF9D7|nr:YggT family protein [uncultured Limosilactobacillus sp.]